MLTEFRFYYFSRKKIIHTIWRKFIDQKSLQSVIFDVHALASEMTSIIKLKNVDDDAVTHLHSIDFNNVCNESVVF